MIYPYTFVTFCLHNDLTNGKFREEVNEGSFYTKLKKS
jgi:hypothetical protein